MHGWDIIVSSELDRLITKKWKYLASYLANQKEKVLMNTATGKFGKQKVMISSNECYYFFKIDKDPS